MQHLDTCLLIAEADKVLCPLILCFNSLFALDVQNKIHLPSRILLFMAGVFVRFLVKK